MRKVILGLFIGATLVVGGCGNKDMLDTVYTYNRAVIELPNGDIIDGAVQKWTDYADGDQIQVKVGGKTYLVHSSKVVLIKE